MLDELGFWQTRARVAKTLDGHQIVTKSGVKQTKINEPQKTGMMLVWSKISNALKRLGFRSRNFLAQLLSETSSVLRKNSV